MLANPIVLVVAAIVAGITALYKAFTRTSEGANKMAVAFAYLEGLMIPLIKGAEYLANVLFDAFSNPKQALIDFGTALVDNVINRFNGLLELIPNLGKAISLLFSGEFAEAGKVATNALGKVLLGTEDLVGSFEELTNSVKEYTEASIAASIANANLVRQEQELAKLNRENSVALAQQLKDREALMNIRDNELLSIEERIKANEDLNIIENEQQAKSLEAANLGVAVANERIRLYGKTVENLDAQAQAEIELANVQADSLGRQNEYILNRQGLKREEAELARLTIDFELEKVNITEKSEAIKLKARVDALDKTYKLYGEDTAEYKDFLKQKELAELEYNQFLIDSAAETATKKAEATAKAEQSDCEAKGGVWENGVCSFKERNTEAAKEQGIAVANAAASAIFDAQAANLEREKEQQLASVTDTSNKELRIVEAKLEKGLINEEQAENQRKKIEEQAAKDTERIQKEAFEKKKKNDVTQALVNGALAITQTMANLGFPAGAIASIGVAAMTAIQVATIKSKKFEKGGVIEGSSHADGGVPIQGGRAEVEGGEVIINKRSSAMFRNELSMINQAGGGVKFANGGVLSGGTSNPADNTNTLTNQLNELIAVTKMPTRAIVSETEITDSQNRINNIESRSSF